MELSGFHFEGAGCDTANVLPITSNLFDCIVAYEVIHDINTSFNDKVLHILLNMEEYKKKLNGVITELKTHTTKVPSFNCMVDDIDDETKNEDELIFTKSSCDREVWDEQVPRKVGLYHAFVRPHTKDSIEHKLFIMVSGSLRFLDEEFHRIWQDCNSFATCEQLLESEELQWFRSATLRNHNRVAARVADALGLPLRCFIDTEDPTGHRRSAHPTTMTMKSDIDIDLITRRVHLVDGGCFLHKSYNGVLFFPTTTLRYHEKFPARGTVVCTQHGGETHPDKIFEREEAVEVETLFPDENFMRKCEALGFNRNNAIVSLMPLLTYITDKSI